jgi:isoleucyl-tRNA synthetase
MGAAVASDQPYVRVRTEEGDLILAERLKDVVGEGGEVVARFDGSALVGLRYSPPFENVDGDAHRVVAAGFVSMSEGTGIVHMAPAFGEDDLEVGRAEGWPVFNPVDTEGRFTDLAPEFVRGKQVKEADPLIVDEIRRRGLLLRAEEFEHTYPLCWRCDTPLIYYARPAWYIRTTARKQALLDANDTVNWYPEYIKHGRYGDWLANNVDWSLSRERYWGTPLPVWTCRGDHVTVVGSLAELSERAGRDVTGMDPHRPGIDEVSIPCPECGEPAQRVPDLIDVWFDSGAMPFAQWHYMGPGSPGEDVFRTRFPADFIAEAIDQTRGWFYTLMAEGVLLFGQSAYRNVVCLGLLLGRDGRRMSTRLGTAIDPWSVIDAYGADALRWFLVSGGSPWSDRRVSMEAIEEVVRQFLLTLWNTYSFFVTYANIDEPDLSKAPPPAERSPLDRWVLSRLHGMAAFAREALEAYDATGAARRVAQFVDDLSNWYVRRSRRRFWDPARAGAPGTGDKVAAYATLAECLTTLSGLLAPFAPFLADEVYRNLASADPSAPESVHLTDFPTADSGLIAPGLDEAMEVARSVVTLGRTVRADGKVRVRQPLPRAVVAMPNRPSALEELLPLVAEELNVKEVAFAEPGEEVTGWRAKPNFRRLGPRLGHDVQPVASLLAADDGTLAARLARGENVHLSVDDGQVVAISPADVELVQQTRPGWGVASDGSITVAVDLEPDERMRREGLVRDLIHHLQALRRSVGLHVTDRITLAIHVGEGTAMRAALEEHRGRLAREVLATDVVLASSAEDLEEGHDLVIDGVAVRVSISRV